MEVLLRVADKPRTGDLSTDVEITMAGDVIVCKPDGSFWSDKEKKNPDWRIIQVLGMLDDEAFALCTSEMSTSPNQRFLQIKQMKIDVQKLHEFSGGKLLGPRHGAGVDLLLLAAELRPMYVLKPPADTARAVGPPSKAVG